MRGRIPYIIEGVPLHNLWLRMVASDDKCASVVEVAGSALAWQPPSQDGRIILKDDLYNVYSLRAGLYIMNGSEAPTVPDAHWSLNGTRLYVHLGAVNAFDDEAVIFRNLKLTRLRVDMDQLKLCSWLLGRLLDPDDSTIRTDKDLASVATKTGSTNNCPILHFETSLRQEASPLGGGGACESWQRS